MKAALAWCAVWGFLVLGCGPALTPQGAAEGYLQALEKADFPAASAYVAPEGRAQFDALQQLYSSLGPEEQKKFLVLGWSIEGLQVTGDSAVVEFTFNGTKKGELHLTRSWLGWQVNQRQTF